MQVAVWLPDHTNEHETGQINDLFEFIEWQVPSQVMGPIESTPQFLIVKPLDMGEKPVAAETGAGQSVERSSCGFWYVHETDRGRQRRLKHLDFPAGNSDHRGLEGVEKKIKPITGVEIEIVRETEIEPADTAGVEVLFDQVWTVAVIGETANYSAINHGCKTHRSGLSKAMVAPARNESAVEPVN
jgi:hypothetical protein